LPIFLGWSWWIDAIEVAFESIEVSRPELAELIEPGIHLLKWFRLQPVETALCVHCRLDEAGLAQYSQMLRDSRLRHTKLPLDLSYRLFGRCQKAQDRAAVRLGNDFEDGFHAPYITHREYTCQGILAEALVSGRKMVALYAEAGIPGLEKSCWR